MSSVTRNDDEIRLDFACRPTATSRAFVTGTEVETAGIPVASGVAHHGLHSIVALLSDVACAGTRA